MQVEKSPLIDVAVTKGEVNDGIGYLLTDQQNRIDANGRSSYRRIASKAINAKGVESIANIEIRFDPSYSTLTLHSIDIVRGGHVIPKLPTAQVRVLQRETSLDYRVFDGTKTASVFLDDVRVGDVVDYSYSVRGSNPVFGGREFGAAPLQYSDPVARLRVRLLAPAQRLLAIESRHAGIEPTVAERGGERIHEWDLHDVAAQIVEDGTPGWYDARPMVRWSEYPDWGAVARWAWPLYETARIAAPVRAQAERIAREVSSDPAERMLAVLRFVQGEIRYLAVSIGPGSHAPSGPERVLERRFGDCKDKARLMVAMLSALGIEARAALVATERERGIGDLQPSPGVFDHVIVRARVGGREFWLDPTRPPQEGDSEHVRQADYGLALIVDPATRALSPVPQSARTLSRRSITTVFDTSHGLDATVDYTITTKAEGGRADALRAELATTNREALQQQYLNYYARYYPKIAVAAPIEVIEDAPNNRVTTIEHYRIDDFWTDAGDRRQATIEVPEVDDLLRQPSAVVRKSPLRLSHPQEFSQQTEVLLPEDWTVTPETTRVEDAAFLFERRTQGGGRRIVIEDRYQSRTDEIPAADVVRYAGNLAHALEATGFQLTYRATASKNGGSALERFNWPIGALVVLLATLWSAIAVAAYRRDPPPRPRPLPGADSGPQGIGGWLILPTLALVISPFRMLYEMRDLFGVFDAGTWAALTAYGSASYSPLWAPVLLFELAANLGLVIFWLLLAVMFFQRRCGAPRLYIAVILGGIAVRFVDLLLGGLMPVSPIEPSDWVEIGRDSVAALIWIAYFLRSKRVRATFVVERKRNAAVGTHATAAAPLIEME